MRSVRYEPHALQDLKEIAAYTRRAWGRDQAKAYALKLAADLAKLRLFPERFAVHVPTGLGLRRMRSGHHFVYYRVSDEAVVVVRILHERRDPTREMG